MISTFKKTLNVAIALSISLYPINPAMAGPVEEAAKVVEQTRLAAQADAESYVAEDFNRIVGKVTNELLGMKDGDELLAEYSRLIQSISSEFEEMSQLNIENLKQQAATSENLEEFIQKYEDTVRKLFMAKWTPVEQEIAFQKARDFISLLSQDFENTCQAGRSEAGKSYISKGFEMPKYVTYFEGKIKIGKDDKIGFDFDYRIETEGSESAAKNRKLAIDISTTAAEITASAWAANATGLATFSAGTTGAMLVAAAPYMIAVVAVVMIVTTLSARAEAYKIAKAVNKANRLIATETPDHNDVNNYYKESCKSYAGIFSKVAKVFASLPKDGSSNADVKKAELLKPELDQWSKDSSEFDSNVCKLNLSLVYEMFGCLDGSTSASELKNLISKKDPKLTCTADAINGVIQSNLESKVCEIPLAEGDRTAVINQSVAYNERYNETYSHSKISDLVAAQVTLAFQNQYRVQQQLRTESLKKANEFQKQALQKVFAFVRLVQGLKPLTEGEKLLIKEKEALTQFYSFRDQVLELSVSTIQMIFNDYSKEQLLVEFADLQKPLTVFSNKFAHISEVQVLKTSFDRIYKIAMEL